MSERPVRLTRKDGSYVAEGGRFLVKPVTMGAGVNGTGGWSPGHREWVLTDTERPSYRRTFQRLYEVRDLIAYVLRQESAKEARR